MKKKLEKIIASLEECNFESEAGPLSLHKAFIEFKDLVKFPPVGTTLIQMDITASEIIKHLDFYTQLRKDVWKEQQEELKRVDMIIEKYNYLKSLSDADFNTSYIQTAKSLINCSGNPHSLVDGRRLTEAAALDIANDCKHMRSMFFGNKRYEGFYQSNDCQYGYGPRHGSTVDSIGLIKKDHVFTEEEKTACIYYLNNYDKIIKSIAK
jgi:hypothetical protein